MRRCDVACIIAAVEASNANGRDTVLLLERGVYTLDPTTYPALLPNGLTSTGNLTIKGAGADTTVIQRTADAPPFRILTAEGRLTIEGVSIVGGDAGDTSCVCGGGIFSAGVLTIVAARVSMNRTGDEVAVSIGQGGGMAAMGPLMIIDSLVSHNNSNTGGGISAGTATIVGSTISVNTAFFGGGVARRRAGDQQQRVCRQQGFVRRCDLHLPRGGLHPNQHDNRRKQRSIRRRDSNRRCGCSARPLLLSRDDTNREQHASWE